MPKGKSLSVDMRKLIITKFQSGEKQIEIARQLRLNRSVISKTVALYRRRRTLENAPKSGRPRKTDEATDRRIKMMSTANPFWDAVKIKKEIHNVSLSVRSIRRRLCDMGLYARRPAKKPFISPTNRLARLEFAREHLNWTPRQWKNVLFSDETKINMFSSDGLLYVRRPKNERFNHKYTKPTVKHGGGNVKFWGCFSGHGMGPLHVIEGTMDRLVYLGILREQMLPFAEENMPLRWTFQQDNDPKHTANIVKEWFIAEKINVMKWPAQSPDLNAIENLWDHLDREIRKENNGRFESKEALVEAAQRAWNNISQDYVNKLISSMPRRCAEVMKNNGYATRY